MHIAEKIVYSYIWTTGCQKNGTQLLHFWFKLHFINEVSKHMFVELGQFVLLWFQVPISFHIPKHKIFLNTTNQILSLT